MIGILSLYQLLIAKEVRSKIIYRLKLDGAIEITLFAYALSCSTKTHSNARNAVMATMSGRKYSFCLQMQMNGIIEIDSNSIEFYHLMNSHFLYFCSNRLIHLGHFGHHFE